MHAIKLSFSSGAANLYACAYLNKKSMIKKKKAKKPKNSKQVDKSEKSGS